MTIQFDVAGLTEITSLCMKKVSINLGHTHTHTHILMSV